MIGPINKITFLKPFAEKSSKNKWKLRPLCADNLLYLATTLTQYQTDSAEKIMLLRFYTHK